MKIYEQTSCEEDVKSCGAQWVYTSSYVEPTWELKPLKGHFAQIRIDLQRVSLPKADHGINTSRQEQSPLGT